MLKQILSFDAMRILRWDIRAAIRAVLLFDVNRILFFDLAKPLQHPIAEIALKVIGVYLVAALVTGITVSMMLTAGWPVPEWMPLSVVLGCVVAFIAPDLRRLRRGSR
jgi:hypothetical protein